MGDGEEPLESEGREGVKDPSEPLTELPAFLKDPDPLKVLHLLIQQDPFQLASRCRQALRREALVLNPERLARGTMARIALAAPNYAGREPLAEWVELAITISLEDMLAEQAEEERNGVPLAKSADAAFYVRFAQVGGIAAQDARVACSTLNGLPLEHRRAFHAVILDGESVDAYAQRLVQEPAQVVELLRVVGIKVQAKVSQRQMARRRRRL